MSLGIKSEHRDISRALDIGMDGDVCIPKLLKLASLSKSVFNSPHHSISRTNVVD
jgi:hypothetical protein